MYFPATARTRVSTSWHCTAFTLHLADPICSCSQYLNQIFYLNCVYEVARNNAMAVMTVLFVVLAADNGRWLICIFCNKTQFMNVFLIWQT